MDASLWARQWFGPAAAELVRVVPAAIAEAHGYAVAAQASSGTRKRDPYGHTLKNTQHERLVAAAGDLPGVEVFHPAGASFELLRFPAARVVLYPWRYATSSAQPREKARMRFSAFRQDLLAGGVPTSLQLTLDDDQADLTSEELDTQLTEESAVLEELRAIARVVTIGYASNPRVLIAVGWGEADLVDVQGTVVWRHWEDLPLTGSAQGAEAGTGTGGPAPQPPLRPVSSAPSVGAPPRFDEPPLNDDELVINPRAPFDGEVPPEGRPRSQGTGTDELPGEERP